MVTRRDILVPIFATASSLLCSKSAYSFSPVLLRFVVGRVLLRHMMRFRLIGGRITLYRDIRNLSPSYYDVTLPDIIVSSRNAPFIKNFWAISAKNKNKYLSYPLRKGNVYVVAGGCDTCGGVDALAAAFPALPRSLSNKPAFFELPELQVLDILGSRLSEVYLKRFPHLKKERVIAELMNSIHPICGIRRGAFDAEWNHDTSLIYKTSLGKVEILIRGVEAEAKIYHKEKQRRYIVSIKFSQWNRQTGIRE